MQARINRGEWAGGLPAPPPPQNFAKIDYLPSNNDSEKKKNRSKKTILNSSKTTSNITLIDFM